MYREYDVFSGKKDRGFTWVESAESLGRANDRMKEMSAAKPGPYFIYSQHSHEVVAEVDTTKKLA